MEEGDQEGERREGKGAKEREFAPWADAQDPQSLYPPGLSVFHL